MKIVIVKLQKGSVRRKYGIGIDKYCNNIND